MQHIHPSLFLRQSLAFSLLVNPDRITIPIYAASTETVPMRWREKVRPAVTDKLTSVRRCVTNG
jgi:hypothetical protein